MGDSYAGSGKGVGDNFTGRWKQGTHPGSRKITTRNRNVNGELKGKDLIGIPWMMAFAPEGGIVLDPFMGAGTSAIVAKKKNREYVGIELNPEYIAITEKRIYNHLGLFL